MLFSQNAVTFKISKIFSPSLTIKMVLRGMDRLGSMRQTLKPIERRTIKLKRRIRIKKKKNYKNLWIKILQKILLSMKKTLNLFKAALAY